MAVRKQAAEHVRFPVPVVVDTREQLGYSFVGLRGPTSQGRPLIAVDTVRATLRSGDYSLVGHESAIAIERKSISDLYGTLGRGRDRFARELARLDAMPYAAVVVEAEWSEVLAYPGLTGGRLTGKNVVRSVIAWQQRHPRVHWWWCPGRPFAEALTFRILERFYLDIQAKTGKQDAGN